MKHPLQTRRTQNHSPILVIGAKGKTGRHVAARLRARDIAVKAASRSGETRFDWNDPSTWAPALAGASGAYITVYPDLSFPGMADKVEAFAKLAVSLGTRRLVLLSGRGEAGAQEAEKRLMHSGAEWVIVRCAVFNQNFSESFQDAIRHGRLAMPVGAIQEPFVDTEDIAEVVVAALTEDRHIGQLYELSGPRLLSMEDVAHDLSEALHRPVVFAPLSVEAYARELVQHGFSEEESRPVAELLAEVLDGRNAYLTDGVQRALGRAPRDFAAYAREAAAAGVWDLETEA